ncbi:MAG: cobalamin biosynthesis protein [ANME-2 cluster archaeon]|nr:cobalamin biosynthesis protein [ANME-2 cluster archaeon]MBC2701443.1 cobalamin biosynthesis protein [ANME-2 cluster archaeon]MBC2706968.1 cobalamin biosynthesis protein [ANME-2 cluster archaeon]MBC2746030.1 cobalamin biosynthesis protein [ANME-2 cluster archaeon]MBC2763361.1 cobalamin biosynthesis protein [ANME-2 cluster archaeon]
MNMPDAIFTYSIEVLVLAIAMDVLFGEPPGILHPVVWMGKGIISLQGLATGFKDKSFGMFMVAAMTGISFLAGLLVVSTQFILPKTITLLLMAYFLKSTFSFRMLLTSGNGIMTGLLSGHPDAARNDLKALVSRDTSGMDEPHIASAVIESVSENFVDTILSPLFFYLILGLPGALAYKAVNTLDSMVGYRNKEFIELGWASARFDDILNWIPARLSLIFIVVGAVFTGSPVHAIRTCLKYRGQTPSPNSGWPMASTAGALGVRLEKQGHYVLGGDFSLPVAADIARANKLVGMASVLLFMSTTVVIYLIQMGTLIR